MTLPTSFLDKLGRSGVAPIPILMYHNIAVPPAGVQGQSLYVPPRMFVRHMTMLRRLGYQGIGLREALPWLRGERKGKVVIITFDDGYRDNLTNGLPILARIGFRATCFVVSGQLGRWNEWDAERLAVRKSLMSISDMLEWHRGGMEIGAHSRSHPRLTQLSDTALKSEVCGSRTDLEDQLGEPVDTFCYPYGGWDARVHSAVVEAGFQAATTVQPGRARAGDDLLALPRLGVAAHWPVSVLWLKVGTRYGDYRKSRSRSIAASRRI